ncbi:SGNH hydrolase domain-containing protein [Pseudomonas sp. NPDC090203]|uniref:SGNH hydrolase domain-containing protein n=1 Tax=Pseudomonas sp. NPDC090203 TaxID=3364477 RepID=UPI0038046BFB
MALPKALTSAWLKPCLIFNTIQSLHFVLANVFFEARHIHEGIDFTPCLPKNNLKKAMIWGDSHAAQYYLGLKPLFEKHGYSLRLISASACPPIENIVVRANPNCTEINAQALPEILNYKPDLLILGANWGASSETMNLFELTIQKLKKMGSKLVILGESPLYKRSVPIILAEHIKSGGDMYSAADLEQQFVDNSETVLSGRFLGREDITYIPTMKLLCPTAACSLVADDGAPAQFNIAHLTDSGSKTFSKILAPAILEKSFEKRSSAPLHFLHQEPAQRGLSHSRRKSSVSLIRCLASAQPNRVNPANFYATVRPHIDKD